MKRVLILLMSIIAIVGLVACGGESEDTEVQPEEEKEVIKRIDETVADDEIVKASVGEIIYIPEDGLGNNARYNVEIEIENKTDDVIEVISSKQSMDGEMIGDMVFFAEEITPGKKANSVMVIENYEGPLPKLAESLEFDLEVVKDMELQKSYEVKLKID